MGNPPGHRLTQDQAQEVIEGVTPAIVEATRTTEPLPQLAHPPLTEGHVAAVRMLEQADGLRATADLYRAAVGFDVYFRPTDKGVTVLALDPTAPAMVGVGALRAWMPPRVEVEAQLVTYRAKRAQMRRVSMEEQASLRLVKDTLAGGLRLPEGLLFVCQEWRFPIMGGGSGKLDLLAVDPARRALVVVELKSTVGSRGRAGTPAQQAERYARLLHEGRQLFVPFFSRLLRAMAAAYGASEQVQTMEIDIAARPAARVIYAEDAR